MITREQVRDLRAGDVVEVRDNHWPDAVARGALRQYGGSLVLSSFAVVRYSDGAAAEGTSRTLTVIERAPRPLHDCPDCTHTAVTS